MTAVFPRLPPAKHRREVRVKILKGLVHPLKICRINFPASFAQALPNYLVILSSQQSL